VVNNVEWNKLYFDAYERGILKIVLLNSHINYIANKNHDNIWLTYHGVMSQNLLGTVIEILNSESNVISEKKVTIKKLSRIAIELVQNIINHANALNSRGTFLIEKEIDKIRITSANLVSSQTKFEIANAIDAINKSDRQELIDKKMTKLMDGDASKENSAGIGLFEVALNSGSKIVYWFNDVDTNSTMFCLSVNLMN
jgi:hypothetical protein